MTVVYFLISILFLILIHEWGHFAAARFFGIGVEKFSIGFGKALFSYTDAQTGTRWQLGPVPLGGFVGLLGEKENAPDATLARTVQGKPFMQAPLHAKIVVLLAGVTVNLLFAALAYGVLAYNVANPALPIVSAPPADSPAQKGNVQSGDLIVSVNNQFVASWRDVQVSLIGAVDTNAAGDPPEVKLVILRAEKTIERMLTPLKLDSEPARAPLAPEARLGLRLQATGLSVQGFAADSAAERAGLQREDILTHIDGQKIDHQTVLIAYLQAYSPTQTGVALDFQRAGKAMQLKIVPAIDASGAYKLGVQFAPLAQLSEESVSPVAAVREGFASAYLASELTVRALLKFLRNPLKSEELAGPVTIAKTAKASAERGWQTALAFLAGLSVSVGVLNLLPVPILDGGQVLYHLGRSTLIWLKKMAFLRARPLGSERIAVYFDKIWLGLGVSFVLLLTIAAFYTDFQRIISGQ